MSNNTTQRGLEMWHDDHIKHVIDEAAMMTWDEFGDENDPMITADDMQVLMRRLRDEYEKHVALLREQLHTLSMRLAADDFQHRIEELAEENVRLYFLLQSLTPGGSEFVGDPDRCAEWVQKRLATRGKLAAENARLRALLPGPEVTQALRDALDDAEQTDYDYDFTIDTKAAVAWLDKLESEVSDDN